MWWIEEYHSFPLTRNKDDICEIDKQMIRNHIRDLVRVSSKHVITCGNIKIVERIFMRGNTHATLKGGATNAN